ncbi:MAG: hypothetical protein IPL28_26390 [Chloroflexi bacterium]|nr:hypothetical protein [Chloroflexota bacterium]
MPTLLTLLGLEKGEERATLFLWLYSFFMGGSYVLFGAVAYTIFLAEPAFGTSYLPYFFIVSAVLTTAVSALYNWLTPRTAAGRLLIGTLLFLTVTVLGYRAALWGIESKWVAFAVLCWNDALWILNNMLYWELAGRTFNLRQAKRLFGLISTGTIVAGIISTFGMAALIGRWGAPNLLWVVAISQAACVVVVWPLVGRLTPATDGPKWPRPRPPHHPSPNGATKRSCSSPPEPPPPSSPSTSSNTSSTTKSSFLPSKKPPWGNSSADSSA